LLASQGLGGLGWTLDWIAGDNGVILVSTDAGATWRISVPPAAVTEKLYGLFMLNKTFGYAVGAKGTILMVGFWSFFQSASFLSMFKRTPYTSILTIPKVTT
jgi:hypothetical protein